MSVAAASSSPHESGETFSPPPAKVGEEIVPWRKKAFSIEEAFWDMIGNQNKSIDKHLSQYEMFVQKNNPYIKPKELPVDTLPWVEEKAPPLQFSHESYSDIGKTREANEDAHFYREWDEGVLAGVFDGHKFDLTDKPPDSPAGRAVANFASQRFQELFPKALNEAEGNVHTAFERVIHSIQRELVDNHPEWNHIGSAAVICYIDKKTHWVFTATLSDCEANIHRNVRGEPRSEGQRTFQNGLRTLPKGGFELTGPKGAGFSTQDEYKSIPLSPQQTWLSEEDRTRLQQHNRYADHFISLNAMNHKVIYSHLSYGVNTPRAFGDVNESGTPECPLVTHKPVITTFKLYAGDILILACDGLKDFLSEEEIVRIIQRTKENLSSTLGKAAVEKMNDEIGGDNVTVIAIKVS